MALRTDEIVVTGLGATTPVGGDVKSFWSGLLEGRSGVVTLEQDWAEQLSVRIAAPMAVDPTETISRVQARRLDRGEQAALVAAREAWADAGFTGKAAEAGLEPTRVAVVIGTGIGGVTSLLSQYDILLEKGPGRVSPLMIPMNMPNGPAAYVGLELGAQAGVHTTVSACASGSEAVALGLDLLQLDRADVVVVGGTEACIHPLNIAGFAQMRAMSTRNDDPHAASRPWDKGRDGFVLGEGAGVLVLERRQDAEARGRDAVRRARRRRDHLRRLRHRPARQGRPGARAQAGGRAVRAVLRRHRARERARHLDPGGRHGRGQRDRRPVRRGHRRHRHQVDDRAPARRRRRDRVVATVLSVHHGVVPPTINLDDPDDELRLDVPREAREMTVSAAINDSFGFGGHNTSVVFRKA